MANDIPGLSEMIGSALEQCLERGMQLPLLLTAVAVNGSVITARYSPDADGEGLQAEPLGNHTEGAGFQLPVNMMIVDATGEAVRILIRTDGKVTMH